MRFKLSGEFVRSMLASHSLLGLTAAALLYLVCVTGVVSVFYPQFERWEEPAVDENPTYDAAIINAAVATAMAREPTRPDHVFINLPTRTVPRLSVHAGKTSAYILADGTLGGRVDHEWTHFLVELHYALNLPGIFGLSLVGILGVLLSALIISGLLAHPNLFKDAFSLRLGGSTRLRFVDMHNRLSVWTSPFQLAIALTGAFIGLSQVYSAIVAGLFFSGDTSAATRSLFLQHDPPTGIAAPLPDVSAALTQFRTRHPDVHPMLITVHEPGTTAQAIEIGARVSGRLVWAEFYQASNDARRFESAGWSDGAPGVQLYASTYRLHFGHFAGLPMQFAYLVLGLALCVVVATGVSIWLTKRASTTSEPIRALWTTMVWGVPLALALSALLDAAFDVPGAGTFWTALLLLLAGAARVRDVSAWSRRLRFAAAVTGCAVVIAHLARFGLASITSAALLINALWLTFAASLALSLVTRSRPTSAHAAEPRLSTERA